MNRILFIAAVLHFNFIFNIALAQSLKDEIQTQKKQEEIEKMRVEDENKMKEIAKSKDSIPRDILAGKAYQIGCDLYPSRSASLDASELSLFSSISGYIRNVVIFDNNLLTIQDCNPRDKKDKYCATKIGAVTPENNVIKFNRSSNSAQNLDKYRSDLRELTDWEFDMNSQMLYFKVDNKVLVHDRCRARLWLDKPPY
jgi:hypothetical protein